MNWLFVVVIVLIAYQVIDGFWKGFIKKSVSALTLVLTLVLVTWLTPNITNFIAEKTSIQTSLQGACSELFLNEEYDKNIKTDQVMMIENMKLPENIKEKLVENNNSEAYDLLEVAGFHDYVGAYLANLIINAMAYLISFVIVWTVLKAITVALDIVTKLPVLHGINKLAGGILGLIQGIVIVWVIFLLGAILSNGQMGQQFMKLIQENMFLSLLYYYNPIMRIVFGMIF